MKHIPEAALNQHTAILGKTGSGKTFTAKGIVEHLLDKRRQVCVLDPTGAWWGIRLGADGRSKGHDVVLLGGAHADIPLSERSGAAVARLVTEQGASVVIDTSGFTVGEYTRWFIDFAGTLYTTIRDPLHLIIDEAHYFMPQGKSPDVDAGRMLHAGNRLMSGGRSKGIRGILITQRPAKLHKDSLTCADTLIAMRVIAPQDRQAIKDWIDGAGDPVKGKGVLDSLASLQRGEGWVWYPEGNHLERVAFPKIMTYDSSATPKHGAKAGPEVGAINLDEVKAALADAVREAEANDPKLLRKRIAELEANARKTPAAPAADPALLAERNNLAAKVNHQSSELERLAGIMEDVRGHVIRTLVAGEILPSFAPVPIHRTNGHAPKAPRPAPPRRAPPADSEGLTRPEIACLSAFKWYALLDIAEPTSDQLCYKLGYSPTSSTISVILSKLRKSGHVEGSRLTEIGAAAVPDIDIGTLAEFHDSVRKFLAGSARKLFDLVMERHPEELSAEDICAGVDPPWSVTSSTLSVAASDLRRAGLMTRRGYRLTETVFPAALV